MDIDRSIRNAIEKATLTAREMLRHAMQEGHSDDAETTPPNGDRPENTALKKAVGYRMEFYSTLDMDAEWRLFSRQQNMKTTRTAWIKRLSVAAIILFAVSATVVLTLRHRDGESQKYALFDSESARPGCRTATLTVDGDSFRLTADSQMEIMPNKIMLTASRGRTQRVLPRTAEGATVISVPRGGEYSISLPDGTRVWLNAGTRLTIPNSFNRSERRIELEGEAYIEVAKNESKHFYVETGDMQIHVTGTAFNVKAHHGAPLEVALASGAVRMERKNGDFVAALQPGQQFTNEADGGAFSVSPADMEVALAWHNGLFVFKDAPLSDIAEQLSLWYNIDITVPRELADRRYSGELNRYKSIEPLLKVLRLTGEMEFLDRGEGRMEIKAKK